MIELRTLGALDLRADGSEVRSILAQPRRLALLAYLACQPGFRSRDDLLALFWPEYADERARAALNRALYYLRHSLGAGVLLSRGDDEVGLDIARFRCDAAEFEAAAGSGQHPLALELYRGHLLSGFHVSEAPGFERWLDVERDRLRLLAHRSAWAVVDATWQAGNHVAAAAMVHRVLELAPWDEVSVQRVIRLFDSIGDRADAIRVYEQFAARMAAELELSPSPETSSLIDAIRGRVQPMAIRVAAHPVPAVELQDEPQQARARENDEPVVGTPLRRRSRGWRGTLIVTAAAITSVVVPAGLMRAVADRSARDPRLIHVARIENRTADPSLDEVSRLATEWIARSVADVMESTTAPLLHARVRVVGLEERGRDVLRDARERTQPGIVVAGEFYEEAGRLRFHVRISAEEPNSATWTIPALFARRDSLDSVLRELSERATGAVDALLDPDLTAWFPLAAEPPTHAALVAFVRGQNAPTRAEAADHYERAAVLDTTFAWARLSAARFRMGSDPATSRAILDGLNARRDRLTPLTVHILESTIATMEDDRVALYRATTAAARLAPSRFLPAQAMSAYALHRPRQALAILDRIESTGERRSGLPTHWPIRAMACHEAALYRDELALARRVRSEPLNQLSGLYHEVRALAALRRTRQVLDRLDATLSVQPDPYYSPGGIMLLAATELHAHGDPAGSRIALQRAIHWLRNNRPMQLDTLTHTYDLALALYMAGEWQEAETLLRVVAAGWPPTQRATISGQLGAIAARRRDVTAARQFLALLDSLETPTYGPIYEIGLARARILALLGDAEAAVRSVRETVGGQGLDLHADIDFDAIRDHPAFRELTRPKG
jgi:DNA-binding SARP family transcriptional activator